MATGGIEEGSDTFRDPLRLRRKEPQATAVKRVPWVLLRWLSRQIIMVVGKSFKSRHQTDLQTVVLHPSIEFAPKIGPLIGTHPEKLQAR